MLVCLGNHEHNDIMIVTITVYFRAASRSLLETLGVIFLTKKRLPPDRTFSFAVCISFILLGYQMEGLFLNTDAIKLGKRKD